MFLFAWGRGGVTNVHQSDTLRIPACMLQVPLVFGSRPERLSFFPKWR